MAILYITNKNDSGEGSLREAVSLANDGDNLFFSESFFQLEGTNSIALAAPLIIDKEISLLGNASSIVKLNGNVVVGANVTLGNISATSLSSNENGAVVTVPNRNNIVVGGTTFTSIENDSIVITFGENQSFSDAAKVGAWTENGVVKLSQDKIYSNRFYQIKNESAFVASIVVSQNGEISSSDNAELVILESSLDEILLSDDCVGKFFISFKGKIKYKGFVCSGRLSPGRYDTRGYPYLEIRDYGYVNTKYVYQVDFDFYGLAFSQSEDGSFIDSIGASISENRVSIDNGNWIVDGECNNEDAEIFIDYQSRINTITFNNVLKLKNLTVKCATFNEDVYVSNDLVIDGLFHFNKKVFVGNNFTIRTLPYSYSFNGDVDVRNTLSYGSYEQIQFNNVSVHVKKFSLSATNVNVLTIDEPGSIQSVNVNQLLLGPSNRIEFISDNYSSYIGQLKATDANIVFNSKCEIKDIQLRASSPYTSSKITNNSNLTLYRGFVEGDVYNGRGATLTIQKDVDNPDSFLRVRSINSSDIYNGEPSFYFDQNQEGTIRGDGFLSIQNRISQFIFDERMNVFDISGDPLRSFDAIRINENEIELNWTGATSDGNNILIEKQVEGEWVPITFTGNNSSFILEESNDLTFRAFDGRRYLFDGLVYPNFNYYSCNFTANAMNNEGKKVGFRNENVLLFAQIKKDYNGEYLTKDQVDSITANIYSVKSNRWEIISKDVFVSNDVITNTPLFIESIWSDSSILANFIWTPDNSVETLFADPGNYVIQVKILLNQGSFITLTFFQSIQ